LRKLRRTALFSFSSSTSQAECQNASPQAISGRTSYRQARLEFLLYSQVIPACCTARGFGPPPDVTRGSPCSYVARLASGLIHATYFVCYDSLSLRIRTKCAYSCRIKLTRWLVLQKARRHRHTNPLNKFDVCKQRNYLFLCLNTRS